MIGSDNISHEEVRRLLDYGRVPVEAALPWAQFSHHDLNVRVLVA